MQYYLFENIDILFVFSKPVVIIDFLLLLKSKYDLISNKILVLIYKYQLVQNKIYFTLKLYIRSYVPMYT